MQLQIKLSGLDKIRDKRIPIEMKIGPLLKNSTEYLWRKTITEAPQGATGKLRRSILTKYASLTTFPMKSSVYVNTEMCPYGWAVHEGRAAMTLRKTGREVFAIPVSKIKQRMLPGVGLIVGDYLITKRVKLPAIKPNRFLDRAFAKALPEIRRLWSDHFKTRLRYYWGGA